MSTRQLSVTLQKRLDAIVEALRPIAKLGVLYGSQLVRPSLDRDIDVIVVSDTEKVHTVFHTVAYLQIVFSQVVHVIVLTE